MSKGTGGAQIMMRTAEAVAMLNMMPNTLGAGSRR
jgi:hypothetical protein